MRTLRLGFFEGVGWGGGGASEGVGELVGRGGVSEGFGERNEGLLGGIRCGGHWAVVELVHLQWGFLGEQWGKFKGGGGRDG